MVYTVIRLYRKTTLTENIHNGQFVIQLLNKNNISSCLKGGIVKERLLHIKGYIPSLLPHQNNHIKRSANVIKT